MRVAICFSGLPRFVKEGHKLFSKNLVGFKDIDVFFHSWVEGAGGNHASLSRLDTHDDIENLYNVTNSIKEPQRYDIAPEGLSHEEFVHWSMFYSIWASNNIKNIYEKEQGIRYDYVIRTRFDCALLESLDVTQYDPNSISTPWLHRGVKLMDWFNFSSSENMNTHANLWKSMNQYKQDGVMMTSGEELLTAHLDANGINYNNINKDVKLIRNNATADTWIGVNDLN
tara:strand:- start:4066 stop:4746 length:681 start_codon:yes stop_codon:yes gene_type:complete